MKVAVDWQFSQLDWARYLEGCGHTTIFHHPGWYRVHAGEGDQVTCQRFEWPDGQHAILPLIIRPKYKGLIREASAGAENGYGGLVSATGVSSEQVEEAYALVRERYPNLRAYGNPHEAFVNTPASNPHEKRLEATTQVLPILEPTEQRKLMNETHQKHCKRAEKHGFRFEALPGPLPADVALFYDLYAEHNANWLDRRWVRDRTYFRKLFEHLGEKLVLFLAWSEDRLSGFRLVGGFGTVVMDLYLATDKEAAKSHVGPYLIERPLGWCYEHGYRIFDFMPSGNLEGVFAYKASFGAQAQPVVEVMESNRMGLVLSNVRRLAKRKAPAVPT